MKTEITKCLEHSPLSIGSKAVLVFVNEHRKHLLGIARALDRRDTISAKRLMASLERGCKFHLKKIVRVHYTRRKLPESVLDAMLESLFPKRKDREARSSFLD